MSDTPAAPLAAEDVFSPRMTLAELSQLAGVSRPAVTNWRRRFSDFPTQIAGDAARPLFDTAQIVDWLLRHPQLGDLNHDDLQFDAALHSLAAFRERYEPGRLLEVISALFCLRALDPRDDPLVDEEFSSASTNGGNSAWNKIVRKARSVDGDDEFLLRELRDAAPPALELAVVADSLTEAAFGAHHAYERLLAARGRLGLADLTANALVREATALICELSGLDTLLCRGRQAVVADLFVGCGDVLDALVGTHAAGAHRLTVLGSEEDPRLTRLTRRRLLMRGVAYPNIDERPALRVDEWSGQADLMVACMPYTVSERRNAAQVLAAVDSVMRAAALESEGHAAIILGPADALTGALDDEGTALNRRQRLLRTGMVEAIIRLPGGVMPFRPGYQTALWLMRQPTASTAEGRVLVCDVSHRALTESIVHDLVADVKYWREHGLTPQGRSFRHSRPQDLEQLLRRSRAVISPIRKPTVYDVTRAIPALVENIREAEAELAGHEAESRRKQGPLDGVVESRAARFASPPARVSLDSLIKAKRLALIAGLRVNDRDILHDAPAGTKNTYKLIGMREVLGGEATGARRIDTLVLAARYGHYQRTQAGDLVVVLNPEPVALIDEEGEGVVEFPARLLRILPGGRETGTLTPRVLAALLAAAQGTQRADGAVRAGRRLVDLEIPDLTPTETRHYDRLLKDLNNRRALARAQLAALDRIDTITGRGIAEGLLTVTAVPAVTPVDPRSIDATA